MTYRAPVADIAFTLRHIAGLDAELERGAFGDLSADLVEAVLQEAGRFATEEIAPLNAPGDRAGTPLEDGVVTMPPGWKEAYRKWIEGGWASLTGPEEFGGQALPTMLAVATQEMWNSGSMAYGIGPTLTVGAVEAIHAHATEELKRTYLPKLVSGEWMGTMNLTEPQAGSDLALLRAKAEPRGDGTYLIRGTKIFITYGEHDLTDNIVHLVLARLPDAPPGTRGISLFLVPKILVNDDGSLGERNDVWCRSVEHKLGIHASPTCVMGFGDNGGAVGWLVGEENRGLACMFTMMNNARLSVGIQGVAIAERATQQALAYARERRQGRLPGMGQEQAVPILAHPDVRRSLMTMRALTAAARAICYQTGHATDLAHRAADEAGRKAAQERANLLTPVAKAFSTDIGVEVASLGVQVHGGMGYIEETGAAQHLRDARIAPIYEGTNGIQAIDLVTRKLPMAGGAAIAAYIAELRDIARQVAESNQPVFGRMGEGLGGAIDALETATAWMLEALKAEPDAALAGATPYLRLFALAGGGAALARGALAAQAMNGAGAAHVATARFFADNLCPEAAGLAATVTGGAYTVLGADVALAG
ncbi:acyl-CoA dehydrogenase [Microbaculum marinum]|uniref:3-methylmercaptopropionyl-CoA dehydrogenase n=1 Tax=Microbaculum marinum TaxID=1764581 RepID=A0AAW9RDF2_9HYPH